MQLSTEDKLKIGRGGPWNATITDLLSGKKYAVQGAPCGAGRCFCDAVAIEIVS
jgi:hypothetical protein